MLIYGDSLQAASISQFLHLIHFTIFLCCPRLRVTHDHKPTWNSLPHSMWSDWTRDDFIKAIDANMLTPITLMKALLPGMMDRGWGRVVNITSQSVKAPIAVLGLSNSARAGLTGYVAGTSRQVAGHGVNINNLLPGIHDTDRAIALDTGVINTKGITMEEARAERAATIPAGRYGSAAEFGAACAFLCSQHAGFIVGQNLLMDGGATNATL